MPIVFIIHVVRGSVLGNDFKNANHLHGMTV